MWSLHDQHHKSWKEKLLLLLTCFTTSLILSTFLFLILHVSFKCVQEVSFPLTCVFCLSLTPAMYFSERIRCFGTLILISMGMKQVKSLLLTLGTSSVIFFNMQNTLRNMRLLAKGLLCNLEEKLLDINTEPLGNYIKMLKWVGKYLKNYFRNFQLVSYHADFTLKAKVDSQDFKNSPHRGRTGFKPDRAKCASTDQRFVFSRKDIVSNIRSFISCTSHCSIPEKIPRRQKVQQQIHHENFPLFDERQREKGKPYVLPLTKSESERYIVTLSIRSDGSAVESHDQVQSPHIHSLSHLAGVYQPRCPDLLAYSSSEQATRATGATSLFLWE